LNALQDADVQNGHRTVDGTGLISSIVVGSINGLRAAEVPATIQLGITNPRLGSPSSAPRETTFRSHAIPLYR
jgi:hypothetical protein